MVAGLPGGSVFTSLAVRAGLAQKSAYADPRPRRALSPPRRQPPTRGGEKTAVLSSVASLGVRRLTRRPPVTRRRRVMPRHPNDAAPAPPESCPRGAGRSALRGVAA